MASSKKADILKTYLKAAKKLKRHLTYNDLRGLGIAREAVRYYFGTLESLKTDATKQSPKLKQYGNPSVPSKRTFDQILSNFKYTLQAAANHNKIEPHQVTVAQFWECSEGEVSEWEVARSGGFKALKAKAAPYQPTEADRRSRRNALEHSRDKKHAAQEINRSELLESIKEAAENVFSGRVKPIDHKKSKKARAKAKRIVTAVLSDIHIGADVNAKETGVLTYGPTEEARRLAQVVKQIVEYKPQYRDQTELDLLLLGDMIQNMLHDPRDGAPLAEQVCRATHLLIQAIAYLAAHFNTVRVRCSTGNHGRNKARHMERATNQKWDSIETILYYSLKAACHHLKNVEFFIPTTPYGIYEVFGNKVLYTHGDTFIKTGYPGKSINIKSLEEQINKLNASLKDKDEIKVVIVGHVHTGSVTFLSNGAVMITNGALVPVDEYAVSLGMLESTAGQFLIESVAGHPVGDLRFIQVNSETDTDSSLDAIVKAWPGL